MVALKMSNLPKRPEEATCEMHEVHENQNLQIRQQAQQNPYRSGATFQLEKADTDVNWFLVILL